MKYTFLILLIFISGCFNIPRDTSYDNNADMTVETVIKTFPEPWQIDHHREPKWAYTNGLVLKSIWRAGLQLEKPEYLDYVQIYYDTLIEDDGMIRSYNMADFNSDKLCAGQALLELNELRPQDKYCKAIETLRQQMREHPRTTEGGFWHKERYTSQMWLDGLFMTSPFLSRYAQLYNEPELFDDIANQITLIAKHCRDKSTGLYYHGWDETCLQRWANPVTGTSKHFWGRAMGWYAMALIDVLDYFPQDHPRRTEIVKILDGILASLADYQDKDTGLWYQVLDQGGRKGNYLEASCSCMFVYVMYKAVRMEYVSGKYKRVADKGYKGLMDHLVKISNDGTVKIDQCCAVAGLGGKPYRDGSYEYYIGERIVQDDPKAVGPFIMASLERMRE